MSEEGAFQKPEEQEEDPIISNLQMLNTQKKSYGGERPLMNSNYRAIHGGGPLKGAHPTYMQTISQNDEQPSMEINNTSSGVSITPLITKQKKPPLTQKVSSVQTKI